MRLMLNRTVSFWIVLGLGLLILLGILLFQNKASGFLAIQLPHTPTLNLVVGILTFPGDGLFAVGIVLILLIFNTYRNALTLLVAYLSGGILVQVCKMLIFHPTPRPVKWFELNHYPFELPAGLSPHDWHSFPSGHSASAATLFLFIATLTNSKPVHALCGIMALVTGYSRIYLYMHFPEDVFVGLIVGALALVFTRMWMDNRFRAKHPSWANKNLLKR
jgi:membrane-associated phospholipid phosphatase